MEDDLVISTPRNNQHPAGRSGSPLPLCAAPGFRSQPQFPAWDGAAEAHLRLREFSAVSSPQHHGAVIPALPAGPRSRSSLGSRARELGSLSHVWTLAGAANVSGLKQFPEQGKGSTMGNLDMERKASYEDVSGEPGGLGGVVSTISSSRSPLQPPDTDEGEPFTTYFDSKIPIPDDETPRNRVGTGDPDTGWAREPRYRVGTGDPDTGWARGQRYRERFVSRLC
ncbi:uncharacterized protein LOC111940541 [Cyanistes caeruleus]|uniref:uncharacterized protein LOC111940541 n=1 Tax=Cyanistes caeruleus TaxID=156563 RepID=UPI000CDB3BBA|nr:uncharacterized protein LOC111940541 [Cyanistes caeruleus]